MTKKYLALDALNTQINSKRWLASVAYMKMTVILLDSLLEFTWQTIKFTTALSVEHVTLGIN